jgi:hypothetical protein
MLVLVACEFSGRVRDAFAKRGHVAMSCDFLPSETFGNHRIGDVTAILDHGWDLMIAHPPCTYLASSGNRWESPERADAREEALGFIRTLMDAPIPRICIENPVGRISGAIRPPDQYVQPWWFGDNETKKTGLWLKNLPPLSPTNIIWRGHGSSVHKASPGPNRWKERSRTFPGIAEAMAEQWGFL